MPQIFIVVAAKALSRKACYGVYVAATPSSNFEMNIVQNQRTLDMKKETMKLSLEFGINSLAC